MIRKAFFIFLFFSYSLVSAQESSNFTQFYMNPYRINPAYAGIEGRGAMFLTYRKQWAGIEGAPTIMNFSFHNTSESNANFGININNDAIGIINSTSLAITLGYTLPIMKDQYIRFGISAGAAMNTFDTDKLGDAYLTDAQLESLLSNSFNIIGDVGLSYHNQFFAFGVSAPNVFASRYDSTSSFSVGNFSAADKLIFHTTYRYYFGFEDKFAIEPHLLYRLKSKEPSQYEAALIFHMNHAFWIGGSYKQSFGISGVGGVKINALFALGYSYSISNSGPNEINRPSHEVQVNLLFGKKKKHKHSYSFTDSKKPIVKKTRRELLAEQHKAERERIEEDRALAAKAAQLKADQEAKAALAAEQAEKVRIAQEQKSNEQKAFAERQAAENRKREEVQQQQQDEAARIALQQKEQANAERIAQEQNKAAEEAKIAQEQKNKLAEEARIAQEQKNKAAQEALIKQQQEQLRKQQSEEARIAQEQKNKLAQEALIKQQQEEAQIVARQKQEEEANRLAMEKQAQLEKERIAQEQKRKEALLAAKRQETKIDNKGNVQSGFTTNEKVAVKRGGHFLELQAGEYVVVGVFSEFENAELFSDNLFEKGHQTKFGFISQTKQWYVYLKQSDDVETARVDRDKYRKLNLFKNAWVLTVEH